MARTSSQRLADMKRRAILDAATAEFETRGLERASLRAIASGAGVTTGAIYSMFDGKDDLYASLLLESLERLEEHVSRQVAVAETPVDAVEAAVTAFFSYYRDRPFEVQLGIYSFAGLRQGSLGPDRDRLLNTALLNTLNIIGATIGEAAPTLTEGEVRRERNAIFSSLFGVLTLAHTGRAASIGTTPEVVLETHVTSLLERLRTY